MLKLRKYGFSIFLPLVLLISIPRTWTHHCHTDYPHPATSSETHLSEECAVCDTDLWLDLPQVPATPEGINPLYIVLQEVEVNQPELLLSYRLPNKSPPFI